jgi:hypothetical protein
MNQQSQQGEFNLDISRTTAITCSSCGHNVFQHAFLLRKVSKFISPEGVDRLLPLDTMICAKCGNVNPEFNPLPEKFNDNE